VTIQGEVHYFAIHMDMPYASLLERLQALTDVPQWFLST
jgi:hypothetical protein